MALLNEGGPAVKFEKVGDIFEGVVLSQTEMEDRDPNGTVKTWSNGEPKKVYVLNVEDESGENRSLWVRGNMVKAIREAAREAKVKDLVGHSLKVQHNAVGTPSQKGFRAPKLFRAKVSPEVVRQPAAVAVDTWGSTPQGDEEPF